jgi:hypothetical protein
MMLHFKLLNICRILWTEFILPEKCETEKDYAENVIMETFNFFTFILVKAYFKE